MMLINLLMEKEQNILGLRGPRKMTVVVPGMTRDEQRIDFQPRSDSESLLGKFKGRDHSQLSVLFNKLPQWNQGRTDDPQKDFKKIIILIIIIIIIIKDNQAYVLNFHGRVTMASVKNFQIIHANDRNLKLILYIYIYIYIYIFILNSYSS